MGGGRLGDGKGDVRMGGQRSSSHKKNKTRGEKRARGQKLMVAKACCKKKRLGGAVWEGG